MSKGRHDVQWIDWILTGVVYVLFGLVWAIDALSWIKRKLKRTRKQPPMHDARR